MTNGTKTTYASLGDVEKGKVRVLMAILNQKSIINVLQSGEPLALDPNGRTAQIVNSVAAGHRSLNGEILAIIDMTLLGDGTRFFTMPENSDTHGGNQKTSILMAAGGWRDSACQSASP